MCLRVFAPAKAQDVVGSLFMFAASVLLRPRHQLRALMPAADQVDGGCEEDRTRARVAIGRAPAAFRDGGNPALINPQSSTRWSVVLV